jgi:hypothetical protein
MKTNLTIKKFENAWAVLADDDGLLISWPKNKLPENAKENDVLVFSLNTPLAAAENNENLAKDILNEILNTD